MKFTCKTCNRISNKKLTLKEKNDNFKPKFCSQDCALAYTVQVEKKKAKNNYKGQRASSKEEKAFGNLISSYFPRLESQFMMKDYNHHYDFYSPELGLIIEYNGTYWHNMPKARIKDRQHLKEATKRGVYMSVITDVEWKKFIEDGMPEQATLVKFLNKHIKNMKK